MLIINYHLFSLFLGSRSGMRKCELILKFLVSDWIRRPRVTVQHQLLFV